MTIARAPSAQELSTDVFPTEDELLQALELGEISFTQFIVLQELVTHRLDSLSLHLLDQIPNLDFFGSRIDSSRTALQTDQQQPFLSGSQRRTPGHLLFKHSYTRKLDDGQGTRYRSQLKVRFNPHWRGTMRIHRDFNGRERLAYRSIDYRANEGILQRLTLGNYSTRFGLGSVIGYRGKLLRLSSELDGESLLYPDYGGQNGLMANLKIDQFDLAIVGSVMRDATHGHQLAGVQVSRKHGMLELSVTSAIIRIRNRVTDKGVSDTKYGVGARYRYDAGLVSIEVSRHDWARSGWAAIVAEGNHSLANAQIKYALWAYGDRMLDLSAGSKTGKSYRNISLPEVDFAYADRRSGHEGGLLKTIIDLASDWQLINALTYSGQNRDSADLQLLSAVTFDTQSRWRFRLDLLSKTRRRLQDGAVSERRSRQIRLESRLRGDRLQLRAYIAHRSASNRKDHLAAFTSLKLRQALSGEYELWANLGRIDPKNGQVNYAYLFVRSSYRFPAYMTMSLKFSYTFDRNSGQRHRSMITIQLSSGL